MIEEISENLYEIEIPFANSFLKAINSYVIKDSDRNLIIDTGWNQEESMNAMQSGLKKLEVDIRKTDFFITHAHSDHIGLVSNLTTDSSTIYLSQTDADWAKSEVFSDDLIKFARLNGFPEKGLQSILSLRSKQNLNFQILKEGDTISIGNYAFRCLETPGHTQGHMCLYEPSKKIFVAGDHILADISPHIQLSFDEWNPLKKYLESLDKVYGLDIGLVLPGHRRIFRDCKERIQELRHHHQNRLDEVISTLRKGEKNAFQIASQMSWDIIKYYDSWELFPDEQKWRATRETIAHLKYLEDKEIVRKEMREQRFVYSLN